MKIVYAAPIIYIIIFSLTINLPTIAQFASEFKTDQISINEGLSQVTVTSILKDSRGLMWFGTVDGLNRFDGREIRTYKSEPSNPHSLSSNSIQFIFEDEKKNLWIGTNGGGLNKFDQKTQRFFCYKRGTAVSTMLEDKSGKFWVRTEGPNSNVALFKPEDSTFLQLKYASPRVISRTGDFTKSMIDDTNGNIWVATYGSGLYCVNKKSLEITNYKFITFDNRFTSIAMDDQKYLWIGTFDMGLLKFDLQKKEFSKMSKSSELDGKIITIIQKKDANSFWVGTNNGLFIFDSKLQQIHKSPYELFNSYVLTLYEDSDFLWVGTQTGGVTKVKKVKQNFLHFKKLPVPNSLTSSLIRGITEDRDGTIWAGSNDGGINVLRRKNKSISSLEVIKHFTHEPLDNKSISSNLVSPIIEDRDGSIWVGTIGYGLNYKKKGESTFKKFNFDETDENSISENRINALLDDDIHLYVGTMGGGISVLDKETKKFRRYDFDLTKLFHLRTNGIRCMYKDNHGNIWLGGATGGIYRFSKEEDGVIKYSLKDSSTLGSSNVLSLYVHNDTLWAGTTNGLFLMPLSSVQSKAPDEVFFEKYIHLHEGNFLPNNFINAITEDRHGYLWISTNKGIIRIDKKKISLKTFSKADGLQSDEFNIQSFAPTSDGYFIFGGVNGLTIFHPDSITFNKKVPKITLTNLYVLNTLIKPLVSNPYHLKIQEDLMFSNKLEIDYTYNIITFEFAALDYTNPERNQYAYKLEGFNNDWVYSGNKGTATYTNLDPGTYTFKVKGSNNDGVWNEKGASIQLVILPPLWRTWWAYSLYSIFLLVVAYILWNRWATRTHLKTLAIIKSAEAENLRKLDTLKSRFFANISHEFRTPLTLIINPLEKKIENTSDTTEKVEFSIMHRNATRLLTLVNQLLDLSRAEAGTLKLRCLKANLYKSVLSMASQFSSMADSKGIKFNIEADHLISLFLDPDKFENIITNLLSNAFKFTPAGGSIQVILKSHNNPSKKFNQGHAEIQVIDTGDGIASEHLSNIFDRFYQVDMSSTKAYEGSGIGLSLTKELVELHHGTIEVRSELHEGSTFTVRLPLGKSHLKPEEIIDEQSDDHFVRIETPHPPQEVSNEESKPGPSLEETVLIIEDNADLRFYLSNELKKEFKVLLASDGAEGAAVALQEIPTLIISDLMMPKKDGLTVCQELKEDERTNHIPIILLTAKTEIDSKLAGLQTGADDYMAKPFNMMELQARIRNLITTRKNLQAKFARQLQVRPSEISADSAEGRFLKKAIEIVELHLGDSTLGVDTLASFLTVSQTQLYRKLQAITGSGPNEFIRHIRLSRAADLLERRSGNVSEIAYQVGFNNLSYFSKVFKEKYGVAPNQFLKSSPSSQIEGK